MGFLISESVPRQSWVSHVANYPLFFAFVLPQCVFPYWNLGGAHDGPRLLGTVGAWVVTLIQWGGLTAAFGWFARRFDRTRQVVAVAFAVIAIVTLLMLACFSALGLELNFEAI